jgi:lipopolysaccharide export system permease protein
MENTLASDAGWFNRNGTLGSGLAFADAQRHCRRLASYRILKILDRYILTALGVATAMGVALLSLVLVLGNVFKEMLDLLINHNVPLDIVIGFCAVVIPFSMTFTIPWGFLTAVLLVFGRLSADNEIIALRSNGVSFTRIFYPVIAVALLLVGICLWINIDIAPRAEYAMKNTIFRVATSNPAAMFQADEVVDQFPDYRIFVGARDGDLMKNLIVFKMDDKGSKGWIPSQVVFAKRGSLKSDLNNGRLLLKVEDAHFEERDDTQPDNVNLIREGITMGEGIFPISLQKLIDEKKREKPLSSFTLQELFEALAKQDYPKHLATLVEVNKRFSLSLAALSFALIAVPLGITAHRKESSVGFALSLVIACSYYFFILMARLFQGNPHAFPVVLIWLPNILFTGLGIWLFSRLARR